MPDTCRPSDPETDSRAAAESASEPAVDTPAPQTVAQLLAESRAHHQTKNRLANRRVNGHHAPDYTGAEAEIALALEKRLAAHAMDPTHADPSWSLDRAAHEDLVAFFRLYPEIP